MLISADGVTITRDIAGHPTSINGIGIVLDADGRPGTLTYAAGKTVNYGYDKGGRLTSVTDWVGGKTTVAYDGAGRMTSLTYPNGVVTTYTYDTDGNLSGIAAGSLSSITLTRDAVGKITSANRNVPITSALQSTTQQFSYDAGGDLTSATSDAMGRVTKQGTRTYTWNLASQLTAFADNTNSGTFTYDGLGEMNSSTASGGAQSYVYNYLFPLPALSIVRKGVTDYRYYVYFPNGTLLYSIEAAGNARHFFHFDEMGNTVLLSGDNGASTDTYSITPYGETADHIGTADNPFTWQGQYGVIQEGLDLFYVRSRHYDASVARFISRDPKPSHNPLSSEPYAYAGGNPLRFIDPRGSDYTDPTNQSPMATPSGPDDPAADFSSGVAAALVTYLNAQTECSDYVDTCTLDADTYISLQDLQDDLFLYPDLDWMDWLANLARQYVFIPGLAGYQPVPSTTAPISPALLLAAGPPLGLPHCVDLNSCTLNTAAGSVTGTYAQLAALITQDGGTLIGNGGSTLIGNGGSTLIGNGGSTLIGNGGSTAISHDGGTFTVAPLLTQDGGSLLPTN
jgi:RHS repeat-associated protein